MATWCSLGQEEDTQAGTRDKELGGREHKGHGDSKAILLFSSFLIILSMCVFITGCTGSSLLRGLCSSCSEWGYASVVGCGLLVAKHGLQGTGSVVALGLSCSAARGSSRTRDRTCVSCTAGRFFTTKPPGKPSLLVFQLFGPI